jgi:hypothetical protein
MSTTATTAGILFSLLQYFRFVFYVETYWPGLGRGIVNPEKGKALSRAEDRHKKVSILRSPCAQGDQESTWNHY